MSYSLLRLTAFCVISRSHDENRVRLRRMGISKDGSSTETALESLYELNGE